MVTLEIVNADVMAGLEWIEDNSIHCVVTSPPYYGLRDYGVDGQIGLEETPEQCVQRLVEVFRRTKRALRDDGTLWVNIGDTYSAERWSNTPSSTGKSRTCSDVVAKKNSGLLPKNLIGIPWMLAFALRADGWYLRSDIIWSKPNAMPESVTDRPTKAHEYIFLLSKSEKYYYDHEAVKEPVADATKATKRNRRTVWTIATKPFKAAHFATFPEDLVEPCILAGCPEGGTVLDPFCGAATTLLVAGKYGRSGIGIELNPEYCEISRTRLQAEGLEVQVYVDDNQYLIV